MSVVAKDEIDALADVHRHRHLRALVQELQLVGLLRRHVDGGGDLLPHGLEPRSKGKFFLAVITALARRMPRCRVSSPHAGAPPAPCTFPPAPSFRPRYRPRVEPLARLVALWIYTT